MSNLPARESEPDSFSEDLAIALLNSTEEFPVDRSRRHRTLCTPAHALALQK